MKIELENLFRKFCLDGINLFTGAGFSLESFDSDHKRLPLGLELAEELSEKFGMSKNLPLTNMATIIESRSKEEFYDYLKKRFHVASFSSDYYNLENLNIRAFFTTNIDNLAEKIFENSNKYYLNNNVFNGPSFADRSAIEFYPLHGSILNDKRPMVFTSLSVASTFSSSPKLWSDLVRAIEKHPILFWGYSLNDSGILQTLNSINNNGANKKAKWIILHKEMPDEEQYFKSLGFNIIIATNLELLTYFKDIVKGIENAKKNTLTTKQLFNQDFVPNSSIGLPVREINEFYLGSAPTWSDIYSNNLFKTSHFAKIQNAIFSKKNTIVLGTPASGKTTLLMQLAAFSEFNGHKIILNYPSLEKANNVIQKLDGLNALIFIDNFTEEIQSFILLNRQENIKIIGFDREHNFEIVSHFIERKSFEILQVTSLTDNDIQEIYSKIPDSIKYNSLKKKDSQSDEQPSLFEFITLNLKYPSISERYKSIIAQLEKEDELLTDFLLLSSYVHHCRTPLSFDMAYSYFQDDISNYSEVYDLRSQLGSLITEYVGELVDNEDQDYFIPRSVSVAETIMEQVESKYLARMLHRFVDCLPPYKISNYNTFRKKGHDKAIMISAFPNWEEGKYYYERLIQDEPLNPYLLQQGALYLSYKSKFNEAFFWIDKARNLTNDRVFSIRNSHAIILFEANLRKDGPDVRATLDRSMEILKECYQEDKRKLYHCKKFGEQALDYFEKYGDVTASEYIKQSVIWISEELKINDWHRGLMKLKRKLDRFSR